jgi:hypothetical protein
MITANDILTRVWSLVNIDPVRTHGATGQKRAFKLMLDIQGGLGFVARRPRAELEGLARRGICAPELPWILGEMMGVELARRKGMVSSAQAEKQIRELKRSSWAGNTKRRTRSD